METGPLFNSRQPLGNQEQAQIDRLKKYLFKNEPDNQAKNPAPEKTKARPTPVR
jgi:hypothetical protein